MLKKNLYTWHRIISLTIAIPVLLWAFSGFFHPVMTNIRPKIATQVLPVIAVDSNKIKVSLQNALALNRIDSFTQFRLVHIDTNWFYQVQKSSNTEPVYLSTKNGKMLTKGNWIYAQYLARQFAEGPTKKSTVQTKVPQTDNTAEPDCCDAATDCVLNSKTGMKILNATLITSFDEEYKSINRILPVYKVSFEREDGIRIYVETTQDRFILAIDNKRALFNRIFVIVHTFGWLDFLGKGKLAVEILLSGFAFITSVFGLYLFFTTSSKKAKGNRVLRTRYAHRITSVCIALFTLFFTFSGAYHAFSKWKEDTRDQYYDEHRFLSSDISFNFNELNAAVGKKLSDISLVYMNGQSYWRISTSAGQQKTAEKPRSMKGMEIRPAPVTYLSTKNHTVLAGGDTLYAHYLAGLFSGHPEKDIKNTETITKFAGEYGFANKRLPVYKVSFAADHNERLYIETATGKLSLRTDDVDMLEGYSFAFLHKHEFLTSVGKGYKDFSTMFWAAAQIAMVTIGLILYVRVRKRKKMY